MTALEKALEHNPDLDAGKVVRYGCPHEYGVGEKPEGCETVKVSCKDCWNQEYKGEIK